MATTRRPRQDIKADIAVIARFDKLKEEPHSESRTSVIARLIDGHGAKIGGLPVASLDIAMNHQAAIITGTSEEGKTFTIQALLSHWDGPVFVLDVANESPKAFKQLKMTEFSTHDWHAGETVRLVPTGEISSQAESEGVLMLLLLKINNQSKPLDKYCVQ